MNREQVITTLRAHERELKEAGIVRLSLFGSTARGDAGPESDIDLLPVVGIEPQFADLLGVRVDLRDYPEVTSPIMWGGQSWPQPPIRRLDRLDSLSAGKMARPTCRQDRRIGKLIL
jgi:predicted nucleotidyltransferase